MDLGKNLLFPQSNAIPWRSIWGFVFFLVDQRENQENHKPKGIDLGLCGLRRGARVVLCPGESLGGVFCESGQIVMQWMEGGKWHSEILVSRWPGGLVPGSERSKLLHLHVFACFEGSTGA